MNGEYHENDRRNDLNHTENQESTPAYDPSANPEQEEARVWRAQDNGTQSEGPRNDGPEDNGPQASFGQETWRAPGVPEDVPQKKKKGSGKKIALGALAVVLSAGICFGAGYAGASVAGNQRRVIIQQVTGSTASSDGSALPAGTALSSEQVAEKVEPSVVAITTEKMTTNNYWFGSYVQSGAGSGVIISEDGYILTAAHVINGASKMTVELRDGKTYSATLVGSYVDGDIAVIKIEAEGLTPIAIADSDAVKQGAACYAVGNPEGRFSGSISDGIVSALDRTISVQVEGSSSSSGNSLYDYFYGGGSNNKTITLNVIQMTAAVSPGNSGGALINDKGELIGIVSAKSTDTDSEGLGFAIPSNRAMEIATELISSGSYSGGSDSENGNGSGVTQTSNKAILGITVRSVTAQEGMQYGMSAGVYVSSITAKSTEEAGLAVGDRIISVDQVMVSSTTDVTDYLADKNVGDQVSLNVERQGKMVSITVTLVENTSSN